MPACADLEADVDAPGRESVEQAQQWLNDMDDRIQVHQLRQFLQTSSLVDHEGLIALLQHFLAKTTKTDSSRDKIDFLLVQYFSQGAPTELDDDSADLAYVAQGLEPMLGTVELKAPVWLNALDRVLGFRAPLPLARRTAARRCARAGTQGQSPGRRSVLPARSRWSPSPALAISCGVRSSA